MSRYIDADALIPKINECVNGHYITDFDAVATILDAPSIDIVFCKECKWDKAQMMPKSVKCIYQHNANDFCSYGERRAVSDLIRRSDAIEFAKYTHIASLNEEERVAWIMNIPTSDPNDEAGRAYYEGWTNGEEAERSRHQPKRGEWKLFYESKDGDNVYKCSCCRFITVIPEGIKLFSFCPNCGADMRERECER